MKVLLACTKDDISNLMGIREIIDISKLIIPIVLIVFVIIKILLSKNLSKELIKLFIINTSLAILILFLPNIVFLSNDFIHNKDLACIEKINRDVINVVKILNKPTNELTKYDYEDASKSFNKIKDNEIKQELQNDVDNLKYLSGYDNIEVRINNAINSFKESFSNNDYNDIISLYEKINDIDIKNKLENEIKSIKDYMTIINGINDLKIKYDKDKYKEIKNKILLVEDKEIQNKLDNLVSSANLVQKLDVPSGVTTVENKNFGYGIAIPDEPIEDMPLVVALTAASPNDVYKYIMPKMQTKFIYVKAVTSAMIGWQDDVALRQVIDLIDELKTKYKIDAKKVVIIGYSIGAIGTWEIISNYPNVFSDAIIVSGKAPVFKVQSFINTRVFAYSGDTGDDEIGYASSMKKCVDSINSAGGKATYTQFPKTTHRGSGNILYELDPYKKVFDE